MEGGCCSAATSPPPLGSRAGVSDAQRGAGEEGGSAAGFGRGAVEEQSGAGVAGIERRCCAEMEASSAVSAPARGGRGRCVGAEAAAATSAAAGGGGATEDEGGAPRSSIRFLFFFPASSVP